MTRSAPARLAIAFCLIGSGCARHLPDQDLRILGASPAAKLSPDDLWKEYHADGRAADARYHGRPIDVSGKVSAIVTTPHPAIVFSEVPRTNTGVEARLLDDRIAATTKDLAPGQRVTLRCFVEGFDTNVVLKSCFRIQAGP